MCFPGTEIRALKTYAVNQLKDSINTKGVSDHEAITCWETRPEVADAKGAPIRLADKLPYKDLLSPDCWPEGARFTECYNTPMSDHYSKVDCATAEVKGVSSAYSLPADTSSWDEDFFIPLLEVGGANYIQGEIEGSLYSLPMIMDTMQTRRCWAVCDGMHRIKAMCQAALERKNNSDPDWWQDLFIQAVVIRRNTAEKESIAHLRNQTNQIVSNNTVADRLNLIRKMWGNFVSVFDLIREQNKADWVLYDALPTHLQTKGNKPVFSKRFATKPNCNLFKTWSKRYTFEHAKGSKPGVHDVEIGVAMGLKEDAIAYLHDVITVEDEKV
jgi:hypothetical protein